MYMTKYLLFIVIALLAMVTTPLVAQDDDDSGTCPALVEEALTIVNQSCTNLSRNSVCYGNGNIEAADLEETLIEDFADPGDIRNIADIYTLSTAPMDVEQDVWGIAVLALQANIPDTLPGQNVTFLLYGDTELTVDEENADNFDAPFQAFRFTSGVGEPACTEAPRDGLLVQSPEGVTVNFMVNGIEVALGSTVLIQGDESATNLTNIEGNVSVTVDGVMTTLEVGQSLTVETVDDVAQMGEPVAFNASDLRAAPVNAMPEVIALPAPPTTMEFWAGMCFESDNPITLPVGSTITFNVQALSFSDVNLTATSTVTLTLNGANLPVWSFDGNIYQFVTNELDAGTYDIVMSNILEETNFEDVRNCSLRIE